MLSDSSSHIYLSIENVYADYVYLSPVDYVVFCSLLIISISIGIYFGIYKKQKDNNEYLLGERKMGVLPVSLSLLASFMSAITLLGTPSEIYARGTMYVWIGVAYIFVIFSTTEIFLPVFYNLNIITSYQYLGMRFHKSLRVIGATVYIVQMTTYLGIVLYAPSLALNAVTGLNVWVSVFLVGIAGTFYTSIGGIKAVMWTDVFQIVIMFAGLTMVIVRGLQVTGGFDNVFKISDSGKRLEWFNLNPDPTDRHTVWSLGIGAIFTWAGIYNINQTMVQRGISTRTLLKAKMAFWINLPGLTALMLITSICGLIVFAVYSECDPVTSKRIYNYDQVLPFFVMDKANFGGLPGLFVACLFSGALSTISSGLNSLAAVTINDILNCNCLQASARLEFNLTKGLGVVYGIISLCLAYVASLMGPVLAAALGLFGMLCGPILGIFFLGVCCPCANWKGALVGFFVSQTLTFWVGFGTYISGYKHPLKTMNTDECIAMNTSVLRTKSTPSAEEVFFFYRISYQWFAFIGFFSAVIVGLIVSSATGCMKGKYKNPHHFTPLVRRLCHAQFEDLSSQADTLDFSIDDPYKEAKENNSVSSE